LLLKIFNHKVHGEHKEIKKHKFRVRRTERTVFQKHNDYIFFMREIMRVKILNPPMNPRIKLIGKKVDKGSCIA